LHSIDGKPHLALLFEPELDPLLIRQVQGDQFLVTFQQIRDRALRDAHTLVH